MRRAARSMIAPLGVPTSEPILPADHFPQGPAVNQSSLRSTISRLEIGT